jgi:hypothetical protein
MDRAKLLHEKGTCGNVDPRWQALRQLQEAIDQA